MFDPRWGDDPRDRPDEEPRGGGIDAAGRVVLLYLVSSVVNDDVRAFLQRHGDLLRAVPEWRVRLLFFKRTGALGASFHEATACCTAAGWRTVTRPWMSLGRARLPRNWSAEPVASNAWSFPIRIAISRPW